MAGPSSHPFPNLRLVRTSPTTTGAADHRPLVLHALGGDEDVRLMASAIAELERDGLVTQMIVHAGAADATLIAEEVRADPGLPAPDRWLGVVEGGRTKRVAAMLTAFEQDLADARPDVVVVAGESDAGLACALAAAKQNIAIIHVEAGLRSGDEPPLSANYNRVLTDRLADTLLTPSDEDATNLMAEGIPDSRIHVVGPTGLDVQRRHESAARARAIWKTLGLPAHGYVVVDLRRLIDAQDGRVDAAMAAAVALAESVPVVFHLAPDQRAVLGDGEHLAALTAAGAILFDGASHYVSKLSLLTGAGAIVSDVGEVQDAASALGVTCFTPGTRSERVMSVGRGTNRLLGADLGAIAGVRPTKMPPLAPEIPLWDGVAGRRVADALVAHYVLVDGMRAGS